MNQNYQGDVSIIEANEAIQNHASKLVFKRADKLTVALGEVTGHHHTIYGDLEFAQDVTGFYIRPKKTVELKHQEHDVHTLEKGKLYFVGTQWEYNEVEERKVQD